MCLKKRDLRSCSNNGGSFTGERLQKCSFKVSLKNAVFALTHYFKYHTLRIIIFHCLRRDKSQFFSDQHVRHFGNISSSNSGGNTISRSQWVFLTNSWIRRTHNQSPMGSSSLKNRIENAFAESNRTEPNRALKIAIRCEPRLIVSPLVFYYFQNLF